MYVKTLKLAICAALVAVTWAVFGQTFGHEFVNFDDPDYVAVNPHIHTGLTWQAVAWAFTHVHSHNWHPLTTLSHMLDYQLFGLRPGAHHFVNVLLHSAAAVLLFILLTQMTGGSNSSPDESDRLADRTGNIWASGFVAALFAVHPLHVESVAWIAERKDVLSGVFFMLTLLAYVAYARKQTMGRYLAMSIWFACGLMSKPMLVTTPLILLLLDYWPLNRFATSTSVKLLVEKIPLLALSLGSAVATLIAQSGGIIQIERLPITWRAANAALAYLIYIWQMIWPAKLALVYPHPGRLPLWEPAGACAKLAAITICAFVLRKRHPYFITGWCWYLVMLLPVIGLIQVGGQGHADRYTYLPQIGLYLAATWSIADLSIALPHRREILGAAAMVIITALARASWIQTSYWHDSERLWRHTLALGGRNDLAHLSMGEFLLQHHRLEEAISEFKTILTLHPDDPDINFQLGYAFFEKREFDLAIQHDEIALKMKPGDPETETNLANALLENGRGEEAIEHYRNVLRNRPSDALAHYNLAVGLHRLGHLPEAIGHYKEALAIDRDYPDADYFLGEALIQNGQPDEAKAHLEKH
jgi:protein O-mannosyl-transferase